MSCFFFKYFMSNRPIFIYIVLKFPKKKNSNVNICLFSAILNEKSSWLGQLVGQKQRHSGALFKKKKNIAMPINTVNNNKLFAAIV